MYNPRSLVVPIFLVAGCASTAQPAGQGTNAPDATAAAPADPNAPKPRSTLAVRGADPIKGRKLVPKEKPRDPSWTPPPVQPLPTFAVADLYPSMAAPGSLVEIRGGGFSKGVQVEGPGGAWEVVEVGIGRIVARVPSGAKAGPLAVVRGKQRVTSPTPFVPLSPDTTFGRPVERLDRGLAARVFVIDEGTRELPSFDDVGDPVGTIHLAGVDVPSGAFAGFDHRGAARNTFFALHATGGLNVTQEGEVELCVESDDGAQLYVEQNLVVDNDGVHEAKTACELVYLEPGLYKVDLLYFQADGPVALRLSWKREGGEAEAIPVDALFRPEP